MLQVSIRGKFVFQMGRGGAASFLSGRGVPHRGHQFWCGERGFRKKSYDGWGTPPCLTPTPLWGTLVLTVEKMLMPSKFGQLAGTSGHFNFKKFLSWKIFVPSFKSMGWLFQESGGRTSPSRIGLNSKDVLEILFIKRGQEVHENYIVFLFLFREKGLI